MTNTINISDIERGTEWVRKFSFYSGRHVVENLKHDSWTAEKREQAVRDAEALIRFLDTFIATGDLAHLADYRGRLEVMAREVDAGAWHTIVSQAVARSND
jgi:hypothetical protein